MKHLLFEYVPSREVISIFGKKKIEKRFDAIYEEMKLFLEANGLTEKVIINKTLLSAAIVDYYNDVMRIKDFHKKIDKINSEKVIAYTSYWILKRCPLQVKDEDMFADRKLEIINERFILQYITSYLSERERGSHLLVRENVALKNFCRYLLYFLVYRMHDAQSLEMIIIAFLAGQVYEQTETDLSDILHSFDNVII